MREAKVKSGVPAIDVTIVTGLAPEIDAVAGLAQPSHAFLRRAWFAAADPRDPLTLVGRRPDGNLIAALPVSRTGPRLAGARSVPGAYWPFRSFPIADAADDADLLAFLADPVTHRALGRALRVGPVYADDPAAAALLRVGEAAGWQVLTRRVAPSWRFDIAAQREAGAWPRGSTLRKNRFFEKHLSADGPLGFHFVTGADWRPAIFDQLADIEARSWIPQRTDGSDAKFLAPHHRRFWEQAMADPVVAAMFHASILTIGDTPAAFGFDLDCGTVKYAIANSYDERFAKRSPGRVLAYRSLPAAADRGIATVDWGAGDSGYKQTLGASEGPPLIDLLMVRGTLPAMLARRFWRDQEQG